VKRLDTDWLLDIIEAIDNVNAALAGKTRRNLDQDVMLRAAISHFVMIISEASRHVPEAYKRDYPIIAWARSRQSAIGSGMAITR
jgi:uncharacterized protein with HEPN domain